MLEVCINAISSPYNGDKKFVYDISIMSDRLLTDEEFNTLQDKTSTFILNNPSITIPKGYSRYEVAIKHMKDKGIVTREYMFRHVKGDIRD